VQLWNWGRVEGLKSQSVKFLGRAIALQGLGEFDVGYEEEECGVSSYYFPVFIMGFVEKTGHHGRHCLSYFLSRTHLHHLFPFDNATTREQMPDRAGALRIISVLCRLMARR
jgi:hypothetical protein